MPRLAFLTALVVAVVIGGHVNASGSRGGLQGTAIPDDPVTMDPAVRDAANPPSLVELSFQSAGARLNGFMYVASGIGPHPTIVLLHGSPGNERNLDVAQAIRRAGANVLYFDYRGNWGSGGVFSRTHALEDVAAALQYVRSKESVARYRSDPRRVALIGHSMGGWLALMSAAADVNVNCVAGIDNGNAGAGGRRLKTDPKAEASALTTLKDLTAPGGPYRAKSATELVREQQLHADDWDLVRHARALSTRPVLLIGAVNIADQDAVAHALTAAGSRQLTALTWTTDHSFSDRRIELARTLVGWLRSSCGF